VYLSFFLLVGSSVMCGRRHRMNMYMQSERARETIAHFRRARLPPLAHAAFPEHCIRCVHKGARTTGRNSSINDTAKYIHAHVCARPRSDQQSRILSFIHGAVLCDDCITRMYGVNIQFLIAWLADDCGVLE
jgi:hypothetical protein